MYYLIRSQNRWLLAMFFADQCINNKENVSGLRTYFAVVQAFIPGIITDMSFSCHIHKQLWNLNIWNVQNVWSTGLLEGCCQYLVEANCGQERFGPLRQEHCRRAALDFKDGIITIRIFENIALFSVKVVSIALYTHKKAP